ncbi:phosphatidylinositol 3-kinase [Meira miltonrushii]|uniref:Phosphatidylinositol 3-kinase VPS34 n=1 Tax=Meira miltonrushii TaxID=1280837 RepID=A0A316VJP5_9BASI|nr:phosphatidylinositol 3-kinase [Meira miltonrushii]PWN36523.1 phosphatidylinositol 3-kinase [Meira miltonrushii]
MDRDFYSFARLCDVKLPLTIRIASLQGKVLPKHDLFITVRLYAENKPLTPIYQTAYKSFRQTKNDQSNLSRDFSELIVFPIRLADLPLSSQITFTVWDAATNGQPMAKVLGGTTMRLFGKKGTLKKASHRLYLWKGKEGDGSFETSTPSKVDSMTSSGGENGKKNDQMARLEKLIKMHERNDLPHLLWLDKLAYRQIEKIHLEESLQSEDIFLYVDLPRFEIPIVYCEQEASLPTPTAAIGSQATQSGPLTNDATVGPNAGTSSASRGIDASLFTVYDGDMLMERENPVEAKHRRLVRSHRSGPLDRELKPNANVRDELNEILSYPPTRTLTSSESDLIWSFRFYLTRFPGGLTKFLKSVSWSDQSEAKQATETLMPMWSEIGMDDALELLGPGFKDARVRAYAVRTLERADDDELLLYLLQLVQALKFDVLSSRKETPNTSFHTANEVQSAASSATVVDSGLADLLIRRAVNNQVFGNDLYWYLEVECEDRKYGKMFRRVRTMLLERLNRSDKGVQLRETFRRQTELLKLLSLQAKELRLSKDARPKKIDKLRALLNDHKNNLSHFDPPLMLPLDARINTTGIRAERSTIFKSSLFPLLLHFERSSTVFTGSTNETPTNVSPQSEDYAVIFKNGDDMRQDQLVIQLFTLMDRLWRNENLDLCIMPYKVMATGTTDGMMQYIESMSLAAILAQYGNSLLNYLRSHYPDQSEEGVYGVKASVFDTYVRSCAGYCVITYILGVGDRHMDNLLLTPDGHFFHVDFGYILNRDPKPFPPPVKVSREMVDAMGGTQSPHYLKFKKFCFTAFITLRKNANLILNLINLMIDANVTDIRFEPDKAVLKVQEKFKLDLSDEEAITAFDEMLNETSYITVMLDRLHDAAQFFRS